MNALIVLSQYQTKLLVAQAVAQKIKNSTQRMYISYGSTNQMILHEMGIHIENYYNGYIEYNLNVNDNKPRVVILNDIDNTFLESINENDIIIKGANALCYENGKYKAAVAVASFNGGTYGDVIMKASFAGSQVIIPVTHEKLIPSFLNNMYHQNSFDIVETVPVALAELTYGKIYTEIDAMLDMFNLNAQIYLAGSINTHDRSLTFVINGDSENIDNLLKWKKNTI